MGSSQICSASVRMRIFIVAQVDFYTRHEERSLVKPRRVTSNDGEKLNGVTISHLGGTLTGIKVT